MWRRAARWLMGGAVLASGCGPISHAAYYLVVERTQYCEHADNFEERVRDRLVADDAWDQYAGGHMEQPFSPDFECGFKDGFADYLYAGGNGEPPPLPPRRYWQARYETPQGHLDAEDWFAGFRQGAAAARSSGLRQWVTVSTSALPYSGAAAMPGPDSMAGPSTPDSATLPLPKLLPDPTNANPDHPSVSKPLDEKP